jgi:hypothetical protein
MMVGSMISAFKPLIIEDDLGPVYPYLWGRLRLRVEAGVRAECSMVRTSGEHPATCTFSLNLNLDLGLPRSLNLKLFP